MQFLPQTGHSWPTGDHIFIEHTGVPKQIAISQLRCQNIKVQ